MAQTTEKYTFRFRVLDPTDAALDLVKGSVDENSCGKLEQGNLIFKKIDAHDWVATCDVTYKDNVRVLFFYVNFLLGKGVRWNLKIQSGDGKEIFTKDGTTTDFSDYVLWKVKL